MAVFIAQRLMGPNKQLKKIEHDTVKNPNWPDANQLVGYLQEWSRIWTQRHCETKPANGQSKTRTWDHLTASPTCWTLGNAASCQNKATLKTWWNAKCWGSSISGLFLLQKQVRGYESGVSLTLSAGWPLVFTGMQNCLNWNSLEEKVFTRWSNEAGKIILGAGQFALCPGLNETPV